MRAFALALILATTASTALRARELPALDRRVVDEAAALDRGARASLESRLAAYEQRTGHQLAVVILRGLEGDALENVSMRAAEQWRLGDRRRDDGLLVVVAMKERAVRVEVGYGLEGVVTDALSSRVIRDVMAPRFGRGDVAGGLDAGLDVLMRAAAGESVGAAPPGAGPTAQRPPAWIQLVPIIVFVVLIFVANIGHRRGAHGGGGGGLWALWFLMAALGGRGRGVGGVSGGGGFSGGGGGFGGGGASGRW